MPKLKFLNNRASRKEDPQGDGQFLIELTNVVKAYETEAGDFLALKNVNLTVGEGEFVGVIGKSGSGKSTLINMISGIDRPSQGMVNVGGVPIHTLDEGEMAKWRGRNLGIVFQFFQLLPILTVAENVMLPMDFCNVYHTSQRHQKALDVLDLVGVAPHANKLPGQLSGGEQQRVAIARALANDPPIILADEPTGNLDSKTAAIIFSLFESLVASGKTILMVTHDNDQAQRVNRTIIIADGEIIEEYLARAFPALDQKQLVWMTSQVKPEKFSPGSVIVNKGDKVDRLYIVTRGAAEMIMPSKGGRENVSRLDVSRYFGEASLLTAGPSPATYRASGDGELEVVTLEQDAFKKLVSESAETRKQLENRNNRGNGNE